MSEPRAVFDLAAPALPLKRLSTYLGLELSDWVEDLETVETPANLEVPAGKLRECRQFLAALLADYSDAIDEKVSHIVMVHDTLPLPYGRTEPPRPLTGADIERELDVSEKEYNDLVGADDGESMAEAADEKSDQGAAEPGAAGFDAHPMGFKLVVRKRSLLERKLDLPAGVRPFLIFFEETLLDELQKPLGEIEEWWGGKPGKTVVFFVPAREQPSLVGPRLAVMARDPSDALGKFESRTRPEPTVLEALAPAAEPAPPPPREGESPEQEGPDTLGARMSEFFFPTARFVPPPEGGVPAEDAHLQGAPSGPAYAADLEPKSLYEEARHKVNWQSKWLDALTPLHLAMEDDSGDDEVARGLRAHQVNLCLLYTADWTKEPQKGTLVSTYAGTRSPVEVEHASPLEPPALPSRGVQALTRIALGAYDRSFSLSLVQSVIAGALQGSTGEQRYESLVRRSRGLLDDIRARWKLFLEGELEEFMGQVQKLEDDVAATVRAFSEQTSALIKSLSETMLAAVAVLLGSFVSALLKPDLDRRLLVLAAVLYLVYLVLFPLGYNMRQRRETYQSLALQFELRRRRVEKRLYAGKVEEIVGGHIRRSQKRFESWFRRTVFTYWGIAVGFSLIVFLGWLLLGEAAPERPAPRVPFRL